jgi:hypothetical protein
MWTYNYTLTSGGAWIDQFYFSIIGVPQPPPGYYPTGTIIPACTAPSGWRLQGPYGTGIDLEDVPGNYGTWGFYDGGSNSNAIAPGQTALFTVTSEYAPTNVGGVNDYDVYSCLAGSSCSIVGLGNIDVPSNTDYTFGPIPPTTTPLPAALPLFATGLGAMGLLGWRRKRKNADDIAA